MPGRKLTLEQLNKLFCSPEFLNRVEATGKPSAEVFLEATDEEVARWLAEGAVLERRIRSEVRRTSVSRNRAQSGTGLSVGRAGGIGFLVAVVALLLCAIFTPFGNVLSPDVRWQFRGESYNWPAIVFLFVAIMGVPGAIGGVVVARLARSARAIRAGFFGIALGVCLHVADTILNPGLGILAGIVILSLPALCAIILCSIANRVHAD